MPYKITWYKENQVMLMTLTGEVADSELAAMEAEAFEKIKNAQWVLHAIVDMREMGGDPQNLNKAFGNMRREKHPNQGISVIVLPNINRVAKFVTSTIMQILRLQFRICDSMEEAEAIINKIDVRVSTTA